MNMSENPIQSIPNWLNEHFLQETLRKHFKSDEITVLNYNVSVVAAKRGSKIYRISVSFGVALEGEEVKYRQKLTFFRHISLRKKATIIAKWQ